MMFQRVSHEISSIPPAGYISWCKGTKTPSISNALFKFRNFKEALMVKETIEKARLSVSSIQGASTSIKPTGAVPVFIRFLARQITWRTDLPYERSVRIESPPLEPEDKTQILQKGNTFSRTAVDFLNFGTINASWS